MPAIRRRGLMTPTADRRLESHGMSTHETKRYPKVRLGLGLDACEHQSDDTSHEPIMLALQPTASPQGKFTPFRIPLGIIGSQKAATSSVATEYETVDVSTEHTTGNSNANIDLSSKVSSRCLHLYG